MSFWEGNKYESYCHRVVGRPQERGLRFYRKEKVESSPVHPTRDLAHGAVCGEAAPCSPADVVMK